MEIYLVENDFNGMTWPHKTLEGAKERTKQEVEMLKALEENTKVLNVNEFDFDCKLIYIKYKDRFGFIKIKKTKLFE